VISATVSGYIGQNAEVGATNSGTPTLKVSIASNDRRGAVEQTTWVRVTIFGPRADTLAQFATTALGKGAYVTVSGTLAMREYVTKDGTTKCSLEMNADQIEFGPATRKEAQDATDVTHVPF
jgi:single stranded DNA-binding protein